MDRIKIFGVRVDNIDFDYAVKKIGDYLQGDRLETIYTPNPEIIMRARDDEQLRRILEEGSLVTADGIGVIYASRIKKKPLKERVTGYDMSIKMLELANENGQSIFLLGGKPGVAQAARENLQGDYPKLRVVGSESGYFKGTHTGDRDHPDELRLIEMINKAQPDIIFVGLGFPKQELFIDGNKDRIQAKLIIGNGGVIDILAGVSTRAPMLWQDLGLEWLYRLIKNPSRLGRQLILPKFMLEVIFTKDVVK